MREASMFRWFPSGHTKIINFLFKFPLNITSVSQLPHLRSGKWIGKKKKTASIPQPSQQILLATFPARFYNLPKEE